MHQCSSLHVYYNDISILLEGTHNEKGSIIRYFQVITRLMDIFLFRIYFALKRAERIIIIKGGPGVGKSTMIRKITKELVDAV